MAKAERYAADTRRARAQNLNQALGRLGPASLAHARRSIGVMLHILHGSRCDVVAAELQMSI